MQFVDKPGEADNGVAAVILAAFGEGAMLIFALGGRAEPQWALLRHKNGKAGWLAHQERAYALEAAVAHQPLSTEAA